MSKTKNLRKIKHKSRRGGALSFLQGIANRSIDKSLALSDTDKKKYIANNNSLR